MIIDTHMHLYDSKYDGIREDVINDAIKNGVKKMIAIGCDYQTSLKCIELAHKYSFIYCAIGLHPSEVHKEQDLNLSWIYELAKDEKVVAIGEIGLDYYWDKTYVALQKEMFIKQINIAKELDLPIVVHSRDSINDCYNIMKEYRTEGVMHCFSSSLEMAKEFTKLGYFLGIGGVVTFKNSKEIKRIVKEIDLKYLVTETDAPYLAPTPHRGHINKPEYLTLIIDEITMLKNENNTDNNINNKDLISNKDIENTLYNNAIKLFKI